MSTLELLDETHSQFSSMSTLELLDETHSQFFCSR